MLRSPQGKKRRATRSQLLSRRARRAKNRDAASPSPWRSILLPAFFEARLWPFRSTGSILERGKVPSWNPLLSTCREGTALLGSF